MGTRAGWAKGRLTITIETEKRPLPRQRRVWSLPPFGSNSDPLITLTQDASSSPRWIGESRILISLPELPSDPFGTKWVLEHAFYTGSLPTIIPWEFWWEVWGTPTIQEMIPCTVGTHLFRLVLVSDDGRRKPYPYRSIIISSVYGSGVMTAPTGVTLAASNTRPA